MAVILALDSSTEACSCALSTPDGRFERYLVKPREHTRLILPLIEELLAEAGCRLTDLDVLAYGRGPGSFTGLRIAAGVVQGLAFGLDIPVVQVSTLEALAVQAREGGVRAQYLLSCLDARIDEVYWAWYEVSGGGRPQRLGEEQLCRPEALEVPGAAGASFAAIGNGLSYRERMPPALLANLKTVLPEALPRAGDMLELAEADFAAGLAVPAEQVQPVYLRDKVTHG